MTTISSRLDTVGRVIESLQAQTLKPDRLIINISSEQYMLDAGIRFEALPLKLREDVYNGEVELYRVANTGPYRKLVPTLARFSSLGMFLVATADDDVLYPQGWLEGLVRSHQQTGQISAYRCRKLTFCDGKLVPYHYWPFATSQDGYSATPDLFPTGRGGILYQSSDFPDLNLLAELQNLAPGQDDLAFRVITLLNQRLVGLALDSETLASGEQFDGFHNPQNLYYLNRESSGGLTVNDNIWNKLISYCLAHVAGAEGLQRYIIHPVRG